MPILLDYQCSCTAIIRECDRLHTVMGYERSHTPNCLHTQRSLAAQLHAASKPGLLPIPQPSAAPSHQHAPLNCPEHGCVASPVFQPTAMPSTLTSSSTCLVSNSAGELTNISVLIQNCLTINAQTADVLDTLVMGVNC